ncbi:MAG: dTDP-4-dehydrorhamnose 3,5-epimerase [bacterium]|nr:dTDP-4-dehydrorhamnose 3,5-epimerase [bacterium]
MTETTQSTPLLQESSLIAGVYFKTIRAFPDNRGRFREAFRKEWFPGVAFDHLQSNHSESVAHVLRGLHYHLHQVDYWYVTRGMIRVGLADLRPSSPTYRAAQTVDLGDDHQVGVFIPEGVAHGFYALTEVSLIYYVNQYYTDGSDENGVAWDDPDLAVPWNIDGVPILSPRDVQNPRLQAIPPEKLPR